MSDPAYMDFEEPQVPVPSKKKSRGGKKEAGKSLVPRLPTPEPSLTGDEIRRGISDRNRSAAKLKVKGYSYVDIADMLEFDTPEHAKRAVEAALAATVAQTELDTQRMIVIARAEDQFKQSVAMAQADYLVLEDGSRVPNMEKLRWHQQASVDLMNIAIYTGARAPQRLEITPGEEALEQIVSRIVAKSGHEDIIDADVIDLDDVPEVERDDDEA